MTVALSLASSERRLASPAQNARQSWSTRAACIITLQGDSGVWGSGEASPLPGFSPDSLAQCYSALAAFDTSPLSELPEPGQPVLEQLNRASGRLSRAVPAARAALEAALLDLWSRALQKPAWALLLGEGVTPEPRSVSALVMGEPEHALCHAQRAATRGLRTFKLKVGRPGALERELAVLRQIRAELGPYARLRLDANQSFTAAQARQALPRFAEHGIELIEEPCAFADLDFFNAPIALALDESLSALASKSAAERAAGVRGARALILKPTLLGGISACYAWAHTAASVGAEVVLSHCFEGPLGLALSAALALGIGSHVLAHGLDLEGARSELVNLPFFSGTHIAPWSEPGFGTW